MRQYTLHTDETSQEVSEDEHCGCGVRRTVRRAANAVAGALRHPIRTLRSCPLVRSSSAHPPYREVDESVEVIGASDSNPRQEKDAEDSKKPTTTDQPRKRTGSKRIKKALRGSVKRYGDSCMLSGSPIGSACIARDIQQRMSLSNYKYVEMREVYVPSCAVFL